MSGHRPRKRFGQHFLRDQAVIERIVQAIDPRSGQAIVEIGPGEGVLTRPVLARCQRLTVIELDRDLAAALPGRLGHPAGLEVIQADALKVDLRPLAGAGRLRVIGNLPYNISTPLIFHLLEQASIIEDMVFMLQKEVVERLVADPGGRDYGRLSVMAGFACEMDHLFNVGPEAFHPPPKVDSAIVRMRPRRLSAEDLALKPALERIALAAFGQRRKTLRKSLKSLLDETAIEAAGVNPGARPETLDSDQFLALAGQLRTLQS